MGVGETGVGKQEITCRRDGHIFGTCIAVVLLHAYVELGIGVSEGRSNSSILSSHVIWEIPNYFICIIACHPVFNFMFFTQSLPLLPATYKCSM